MASLSSRPLRQTPLKKSTPQYGRITRTSNYKEGGSLPLLSTQTSTIVPSASASLIRDPSSSSSSYGTIRKTGSLRSAEPPQQRRSPRAASHRKVGADVRRQLEPTAQEPEANELSASRFPQTGSPEINRKNHRSSGSRESKSLIAFPSSSAQEVIRSPVAPAPAKIPKKVDFSTVQVHYEETAKSPTKTFEINAYEKERGPTRPPAFFLKSEAELRDLRRIRQIEDARADEEWQAIREVNTVIQADVEEIMPNDPRVLAPNRAERGFLENSILEANGKKKKTGWIRGLFKRKPKAHPLADI